MKVRFLALAQQELDDAVTWYNEQAAGLDREFLLDVDTVDDANRNPVIRSRLFRSGSPL